MTEAPLTQVVRLVRILSLQAFNFNGRTVEVLPPLPRRLPALPLIEQLQAELYANAYCIRIEGTDFGSEEGEDHDMYNALTAANTSRARFDDNWLVIEIDSAGAVSVSKYGVVRRIPPTEIFPDPGVAKHGSALPARLGQLVTTLLPREYPEQGGFYFAFGEAVASSLESRPAVRFYWSVPVSAAVRLMAAVTHTLNSKAIPFVFKCPRRSTAYRRFDSGTLFIGKPWVAAAASALPKVYEAVADLLRPDVPLFTRQLRPGLSFAEDPGGNESFGMSRCRLLAEGLWIAFVEGTHGTEASLDVIERHLLQNGIDLSRPYLNPWSVDRYNLDACV
jgi:hypothetical protein